MSSLSKAMGADDVLTLSAQMSFYFVLAMFPFLISLAALVTVLRFSGSWPSILAWIILYLPASSRHLVFQTIAASTRPHEHFLSFGLIGTAWAATGGIMSLIAALNVVYKVKETRGYLHRVAFSFLVLLILAVLFLAAFGLREMGSLVDTWLAGLLHSGGSLLWLLLWKVGRWVLAFVLAALGTAVIDNLLPNHKRGWRWVTAGSIFTVIAWALATSGFNFYISRFGSYQRTYGVLGTFIVLMLWIYAMSLMILVGAEINCYLAAARAPRRVLSSAGVRNAGG
ncbi:MAG: YihY/virulence factor BrkB family protein [Terriglobia bacterium]